MQIQDLGIIKVKAGWRIWMFCYVKSNEFTGWSELSDSNCCIPATESVFNDLKELIIGAHIDSYSELVHKAKQCYRQNFQLGPSKALAGLENALFDLFCKCNRLSARQALSGLPINGIPCYWSHFGTTRIRAADCCKLPRLNRISDINSVLDEALQLGITTVKSNILCFTDGTSYVYMPQNGRSSEHYTVPSTTPDQTKAAGCISEWITHIHQYTSRSIGVAIDLNYNISPYILQNKLSPSAEWYEFDTDTIDQLYSSQHLRLNVDTVSGENWVTSDSLLKLFQSPIKYVSVDPCWTGLKNFKHATTLSYLYGKPITLHNFNGHLSTFMAASLSSIVDYLHYIEYDHDDVPWRDEIFTARPKIIKGNLHIQEGFGWGCDLDVENAAPYIL